MKNNPHFQNAINNFVFNSIYNQYNQELQSYEYLNDIDRTEAALQFVDAYYKMQGIKKEIKEDDEIVKQAAITIDELIPRFYFIEYHEDLCKTYSPLLVRRMYDTQGKDFFAETKAIKYHYHHDFHEREEIIKKTKATQKQIEYLKKIGESAGYLLWNEEYLSKNYANQLIEFLSEKVYEEPVIFPFFFVLT